MKINRWSCKCKSCKAKWTTEQSDRVKAYAEHGQTCRFFDSLLQIRMSRPDYARIEDTNRRKDTALYDLSCFLLTHIQIEGHYREDKKCDGRCIHATGHDCECSCGGKNHGMAAAA